MTENWSVRVLERNIKSGYYKRMLPTQLPNKENKVLEFVKDPFVFFQRIRVYDERYLKTDILLRKKSFLNNHGLRYPLFFVQ